MKTGWSHAHNSLQGSLGSIVYVCAQEEVGNRVRGTAPLPLAGLLIKSPTRDLASDGWWTFPVKGSKLAKMQGRERARPSDKVHGYARGSPRWGRLDLLPRAGKASGQAPGFSSRLSSLKLSPSCPSYIVGTLTAHISASFSSCFLDFCILPTTGSS